MPQTNPPKGAFRARVFEEAMDLIASLPAPEPEVHEFRLEKILGRVLAQDIVAPFAVPGFRRSRFDGIAARSEDLAGASPATPVRLRVLGTVAAGSWPAHEVTPRTCLRVMTGAPVPDGADAIVPFERMRFPDDDFAEVPGTARPGAGVVPADMDTAEGQVVLTRGTRLQCVHLERLGMLGVTRMGVFARPRVAILSTGSELLLPGMPRERGRIYASAQPMLSGRLWREGAVPIACGIAPDDETIIASTIQAVLRDNTMLVLTGGVGPGDFDLVPRAIRRAGADILVTGEDFHPGGNFIVATLRDRLILALSGSPGSALLALHLLALPLVRRLSQASEWRTRTADVLLGALPASVPHGLLPGRLCVREGRMFFEPMRLGGVVRGMPGAILSLAGDEPLERWMAEGRPVRAYLTSPQY